MINDEFEVKRIWPKKTTFRLKSEILSILNFTQKLLSMNKYLPQIINKTKLLYNTLRHSEIFAIGTRDNWNTSVMFLGGSSYGGTKKSYGSQCAVPNLR